MRVIDADALMREFAEFVRESNNSDFADIPTWNDAVSLLGSAPTIDAVEIVRCRDCIHKPYVVDVFHASYGDVPVLESNGKCPCINADDYFYSHMPDDDWFCANGERREADEEEGV